MKRSFSVVLIILPLVLVFLYLKLFWQGQREEASPLINTSILEVQSMVLEQGSLKVKLDKTGDTWSVEPAFPGNGWMSRICGIYDMITRDSSRKVLRIPLRDHQAFGLTDGHTLTITIEYRNNFDTLRLGGIAPDSSFIFIRKNSEPRIHVFTRNLRMELEDFLNQFQSHKDNGA